MIFLRHRRYVLPYFYVPLLVNPVETLTLRIYYDHKIINSTRNRPNRLTPHLNITIKHNNNQSPKRKKNKTTKNCHNRRFQISPYLIYLPTSQAHFTRQLTYAKIHLKTSTSGRYYTYTNTSQVKLKYPPQHQPQKSAHQLEAHRYKTTT